METAGVFAVTAVLSAILWKAAPRLRLLAHPNPRSSHTAPTPSGGGCAFVVAVVGWLVLFGSDFAPALVLAVGGVVVAATGLVDDIRDVPPLIRLGWHFGVAAGCVGVLFAPDALLGAALVVGLAWWLNLYNFMDGIDGIAASQAAAYGGGVLLLAETGQAQPFAGVLLAAMAGFLVFNWAPAKLFMGDVGSGFLGLVTGVFALWLAHVGEVPAVASAILLLAFWFDATYTLIVRIVTRQAFASAHRSHLYQVLARRLGHGTTTTLFCLHFAAWLLPLAWLAIHHPRWQFICLVVACLPIAIACAVFRAGSPTHDSHDHGEGS